MAEYSYPRIDFKMSGFAKKEVFGRRSFLERSAAANAGAFVLPRFSIGQAGPSVNSKLKIAMIGVLAQRLGGRIEWGPVKGAVINRPELNAFVKEPVRAGWSYGEDLRT